jgi:hypothetical protein
MQYQPTRKLLLSSEFFISVVAALIGTLGVWYIHSLGLVRELTDAYAHLNFSKMFFESLTPGVSQIGFWPPLLHVLMAPFTLVPALYQSGLAGAVVLVPFYILGAVYSYKLLKLMTENEILSWIGAILFMVNPYVLYYASVPMMEVLFLGNLMCVSYYLARWFKHGQLSSLVLTGIFVTLAALSRFEGLILVPIVGTVLAIDLFMKKREHKQIQAVLILFLLVAVVGPLVILSYSWFFGDSPLAFTGGDWIKPAAMSEGFQTKDSIVGSFRYMLHASYYMIGQNLVWFAAICLPFLALISRRRFETFSVLLILASPLIFIIIALTSGSYNIGLPELPPGKLFLNERYGLSWIGFAIIAPLLLFGAVLKLSQSNRFLKYAARFAVTIGAIALLLSSADFMNEVARQDKYFVIRNNINSPRGHQSEIGRELSQEYDYGKVLLARSDNDPVLAMAGIPLDEYIYEANYLYFDQAVNEPWLFARWVVMNNVGKVEGHNRVVGSDLVAQKWDGNEQFNSFYELVYENIGRRLYKVRDEKVAEYAKLTGLDLSRIPSVNKEIAKWDPAEFYKDIRVSLDVKKN